MSAAGTCTSPRSRWTAVRWTYEVKLPTATVQGTQVLALSKGRLCTISFSTDHLDRYEIDTVIPTIRLT